MIESVFLPISLALLMLSIGLSINLSAFPQLLRRPGVLIASLLSLALLSPAIGWAITMAFGLNGALALGLFLLASCPGGLFSNAFVKWAGADLEFSITLTSCMSLLYIVTAPLYIFIGTLFYLGEGQNVDFSPFALMAPVVAIMLTPIAVGASVKHFFHGQADWIQPHISNIASVAVIGAFLAILWRDRIEYAEAFSSAIGPVILLNVSVLCAAAVIGRMVGAAPRTHQSIVFEHIIRQEGLAIFVVVSLLSLPKAALPLLLNSGVGFLVGLILYTVFRGARLSRATQNSQNEA